MLPTMTTTRRVADDLHLRTNRPAPTRKSTGCACSGRVQFMLVMRPLWPTTNATFDPQSATEARLAAGPGLKRTHRLSVQYQQLQFEAVRSVFIRREDSHLSDAARGRTSSARWRYKLAPGKAMPAGARTVSALTPAQLAELCLSAAPSRRLLGDAGGECATMYDAVSRSVVTSQIVYGRGHGIRRTKTLTPSNQDLVFPAQTKEVRAMVEIRGRSRRFSITRKRD